MASGSREPATEWDWRPGAEGGLATRRRQPGAEGVHTEQRLRVSQPLFCIVCSVKQA